MKAGRASRTAEWVCFGRAVAHRMMPERFQDPTAEVLLSDSVRAKLEKMRVDPRALPRDGLRARLGRGHVRWLAAVMVARTVAIDEAVRAAASPQLVILGAGLDGRAWRMPELGDAIVLEVDHPDSQREKKARIATLTQAAREVRFVPVDFTRDDLYAALEAAGHDATLPTTWIWEGVVMYLSAQEVENTLSIVARRSAPKSRLVIMYLSPTKWSLVVSLFLRRLGEPLRSSMCEEAMRTLLARHDFIVTHDESLDKVGKRLGVLVAAKSKREQHHRIVTADARAS